MLLPLQAAPWLSRATWISLLESFWDLQTVGLSMANAFAAPTWLFEGAFQWILVCGQSFLQTDGLDQGGDRANDYVCLSPCPHSL